MKPKKVLFIHGGTLQKAGTETYMMSVFRNIDPLKYTIDFVVFGEKPGAYDQEVLDKNSIIFRIPTSISKIGKLKAIKNQIKEQNYDIVHAHMNALNAPILKIFKKLGIPILISHSHGSKHFVQNNFLILIKESMKKKISKITPYLLACSKAAGDFLYGDAPYTIINNGVDTLSYDFNKDIRLNIRRELKLTDEVVYGHVGRFNFQKNHKFLIDVFANILKKQANSHLILIGEGELHDDIINQIDTLGIKNNVTLLGVRDDIPNILQALDCFIMPSVFEGLPFALVEAQASGLQCFAADTIDSQSKILDTFHFLPLSCPESWSNYILENLDINRHSTHTILAEKGFDVFENVKTLEIFYEATTKRT